MSQVNPEELEMSTLGEVYDDGEDKVEIPSKFILKANIL